MAARTLLNFVGGFCGIIALVVPVLQGPAYAAPPKKPAVPWPTPLVTVTSKQQGTFFNRNYDFRLLSGKINSVQVQTLQISGDGIIVSFYSSKGPYLLSIAGNVASYGGHSIEFLAQPNQYKIDGNVVDIKAPGVYAMANGAHVIRLR